MGVISLGCFSLDKACGLCCLRGWEELFYVQ